MRISPLNSIAHSLNRSNHIRFNFSYFSSVPNWKRFTVNFNELAHKLNWFSDKFCANFRSSLHTQKKVQSARSHFNRWHTCLHLQARKRFIPFLLRDQNWNKFEEKNLLWKMAFQYKFQKWLWLIKANEMIDKSHLFRHLFLHCDSFVVVGIVSHWFYCEVVSATAALKNERKRNHLKNV